MYLGRPAIAIYFRDKTKRIYAKLHKMRRQEEKQILQQSESFTSTISHEMRTPILTIIFFVKQILEILESDPLEVSKIPKGVKFCRLALTQLEFLQSFIFDLLDLR